MSILIEKRNLNGGLGLLAFGRALVNLAGYAVVDSLAGLSEKQPQYRFPFTLADLANKMFSNIQ